MLKKFKSLNTRGDTIVEVMIVLAVLGLAISTAYATANRSLLDARQAQENAVATQLVQSQVEALRTMTLNSPSIFSAATWPGASPYDCVTQSPPYAVTNSCTAGTTVKYQLSVTYTNSPTDTFTVVASWDDIFGNGKDTVTMNYRLHAD